MPSPHESPRSRKAGWGYWAPLAISVAVATAGIAVWAWNQRVLSTSGDVDMESYLDYTSDSERKSGSSSKSSSRSSSSSSVDPEEDNHATNRDTTLGRDQASNISPETWHPTNPSTGNTENVIDSARETVTTGIASAGTVIPRALNTIREEDRISYADHEIWSEQVEAKSRSRDDNSRSQPNKKQTGASLQTIREPESSFDAAQVIQEISYSSRKTRQISVAVAVSADSLEPGRIGPGKFIENSSILSLLPKHINPQAIKLYILIYAPTLKDEIEGSRNLRDGMQSSSSLDSYMHIEHSQSSLKNNTIVLESGLDHDHHSSYSAMYYEALSLVQKKKMVLPFTNMSSYPYILRHIKPDIIYLQESLAGEGGTIVSHLQSWFRHDIAIIVGAGGKHVSSLADSDSEAEIRRTSDDKKWWQRPERVGRGRGVIVVDAIRLEEDWSRRVEHTI